MKSDITVLPPERKGTIEIASEAERRAKVWDGYIKGIPVSALARVFQVSDAVILDDISAVTEIYRQQLLKSDAVGIISANIQWLDEIERIALYEAHQLEPKTVKTFDPVTGTVKESRTEPDPNRAKFFQQALEARKMKIKLLQDAGIIPRAGDPAQLFKKLGDQIIHEADTKEERTPDQIAGSIEKLLKFGQIMLPANHPK